MKLVLKPRSARKNGWLAQPTQTPQDECNHFRQIHRGQKAFILRGTETVIQSSNAEPLEVRGQRFVVDRLAAGRELRLVQGTSWFRDVGFQPKDASMPLVRIGAWLGIVRSLRAGGQGNDVFRRQSVGHQLRHSM